MTNGEALVRFQNTTDNGQYTSIATADSSSTHPAYLGPWGTPTGFTYNWDMDRTRVLSNETILGTHSGSYPWWIVREDGAGVRTSSILASLLTCNEGDVGAGASSELEIVFKNTVAWLLDM